MHDAFAWSYAPLIFVGAPRSSEKGTHFISIVEITYWCFIASQKGIYRGYERRKPREESVSYIVGKHVVRGYGQGE